MLKKYICPTCNHNVSVEIHEECPSCCGKPMIRIEDDILESRSILKILKSGGILKSIKHRIMIFLIKILPKNE